MRCYLTTLFLVLILITQGFSSQAQQFRVKRIQREQYTPNGIVKTDSAVFYYPGNRAGQVTWQWAQSISEGGPYGLYMVNPLLSYDAMVSKFDHSWTSWAGPQVISRVLQKFDASGHIIDYALYQPINGSGNASIIASQTSTYAGNILTERVVDGTRLVYIYQNGVLQFMDSYPNGSSNLKNTWRYSYDLAGNLTEISSYSPLHSDTLWQRYSYDVQNRMIEEVQIITGNPVPGDTVMQELYTYDNNGDLVQQDRYNFDYPAGPNMFHTHKWVSTYDNQHRKTEMVSHYRHYSGMPLAPRNRRSFTYDTNHDLIVKLQNENWDGNQWVSRADTSTASSSHTYTFEYEVAWPTTLPEVEDAANVKLYPSPASDFIRIETEWKQATPFTAAILDMQGRTVRQWNEPATKNYARTIPLTELPAGSYFIKLSSGEQQYTKQFVVYK